MKTEIYESKEAVGSAAAAEASKRIREAIDSKGSARIIAATGASQFAFLAALIAEPGIRWDRVVMFHLDEYIDLPDGHPASFRRYLKERLIDPTGIRTAHLISPSGDATEECARVGRLIMEAPIDVAFVGIGENGHLAFNDPPADFETEQPYLVVKLDDRCRTQQMGEGWFPTLGDVPDRAISMSVRQIMKSHCVLCIVPELRKAEAVKNTVEGPVTPMVPASILQEHPDAFLYLDRDSASQLKSAPGLKR
jgi:glucosamine-6-phosphate deaminase